MPDADLPPLRTPDFAMTLEGRGATVRVTLAGELDIYRAPEVRDALTKVIGEGATRVEIDMADVSFVDSTGLGALVNAIRQLRAVGGELVLDSPRTSVRKVLEIAGMARIATIT